MEVSVEKAGVCDVSKNSRSLDLKSIQKSRGSIRKSWAEKRVSGAGEEAKALKRKRRSSFESIGSVLLKSGRKRSRKEVSLNSFDLGAKRQRNGFNASRLKRNGFVSGVGKPPKLRTPTCATGNLSTSSDISQKLGNDFALPVLKKKDNGILDVRNSENSNCLVDNIVIPKRPRGASGRNKIESFVSLTVTASKSTRSKNSAEAKNNGKWKRRFNELRENGSGRDSSVSHSKGENGRSTDISSRKAQSRKKGGSSMVKKSYVENDAPLIDNNESFYGDFQEDDDEENLEQNAARMLSSRFDPRCTGFSANKTQCSAKVLNGSLAVKSSHGNLNGLHTEDSTVDAAGRVLRPRKRNRKGFFRKRRHFYEVSARDMDPYCVIKQRIRVFWPLDKSWYFGLVKDYDPVTGLHHVKYDDRDEEWINLENERFKLLLFPSELSSRSTSANGGLRLKQKNKEEREKPMDDNFLGGFMESEPIISWLARSTNRMKLSAASVIKKHSRNKLLKDSGPSIMVKSKGEMSARSSYQSSSKLSPEYAMPERSFDGDITEVPVKKRGISSGDRKVSFVYFRKRFRKQKDGLGNIVDQDFLHGSPPDANSILDSVAYGEATLGEVSAITTSMELKQVILKLNFPLQCIQELAFGAESFWLCHAFLLQYGKLMCLSQVVCVEMVIVDNVLGLRFLLFEVCLRQAVALLCLVLSIFYQHNEQSNFSELRMPYTSVRFKISSFCDQGGHLLFILFSFFKLENSKWRHLEDRLKHHCIKMKELHLADCTYSNIKNFHTGSGQILSPSVFKDPLSPKDFPERSCIDLVDQLVTNKSAHMNANHIICCLDQKYERPALCPLSFTAAPSFLLGLHLKLLIQNNATSVCSQEPMQIFTEECLDDGKLTGCSPVEGPANQDFEITSENMGPCMGHAAACSGKPAFGHLKVEREALPAGSDGIRMKTSDNVLSCEVNLVGNFVAHRDLGKDKSDDIVDVFGRFPCQIESVQADEKPCSSNAEVSSSDKSDGGCNSCLNTTDVQAESFDVQAQLIDPLEEHLFGKETKAAQSASDSVCEMNEHRIHGAKPTAPPSVWHHNGHGSVSCTLPKLWPEDFMRNGFGNGSKKPRTQVTYSLSSGSYVFGSKPRSKHRKMHACKKVKTNDAKRSSGCLGSSQRYMQSLTCDANVLVTVADRGWRECGTQVVLDSDDQKDWRICVKFSGVTKYVHKAHHFLQPGATNRFTHAMMWKGGKDWSLEFTDRSQWSLFKQMHEECYNRNMRAASVKNIPIPGVRLIADGDDNIVEVPFIRSSTKYFRQVGTEVDIALDPSCVAYDMDSDDEEWISKVRNSSDVKGTNMSDITEDLFERVMDMFEKFAYTQQCDEFTTDELEELMADEPLDIIEAIYGHWRRKRQKKGMPLIRQFQPALWERYQQQLKEWELAMSKMHSSFDGSQDKSYSVKKPPMFAFCLRPRGLEVPNKGSKQRSHKKLMFTGHHIASSREPDCHHTFGRKLNGHSVGEEKGNVAIPNYESSDSFHWLQSPSSFSPRDSVRAESLSASDSSEKYPPLKLHRSNSRKAGMFPSPRDSQISPFSYHNKTKRNGVHRWSTDMYEWPSTKPSLSDGFRKQGTDIDEFQLRDASSAAQHASNMAKLKREKAQWLLHKADLALHRAMVALMTAEAIKASEKDFTDDG